MEVNSKRPRLTIKVLAAFVGASCAVAATVPALGAAKIEVDEDTWLSVGAGLRTSYTSIEDASPDGKSRRGSTPFLRTV